MSGTLVLTHGIPGSGKSTWAMEQVAEDPQNRVRVNRDDIRTSLFGEEYHKGNFPKKSEAQVRNVQFELVTEALRNGKTVYCDDTNLVPQQVARLVSIAKNYNTEIKQEYFNVSVEECKRRNQLRASAGGREVPEFVIDGMAKDAYDDEGSIKEYIIHDNGMVSVVSRNTTGMKKLEKFNNSLQQDNPIVGKAVTILDIDGSLFDNEKDAKTFLNTEGKKKNFHGFYTSIETAEVNEKVLELANNMREKDGINIVVVTGRTDDYASHLINAIKRSGVKASKVIMKREGDYRPSNEHKRDTVKKIQEEGFVVVHAIEDRDKDLNMFRELGVMTTMVKKHDLSKPAEINTIYGSGYCIRCGQPLKNGGNLGPTCRTKI